MPRIAVVRKTVRSEPADAPRLNNATRMVVITERETDNNSVRPFGLEIILVNIMMPSSLDYYWEVS
jgi:hypothetical protein